MRRSFGLAAFAAFALLVNFQAARAQLPAPEHPVFGHMLNGGTGMIATPHAMVPPTSIFGTFSAIPVDRPGDLSNFVLLSGSGGVTLARFVEVGGTLYHVETDEVDIAAFAKVQIIQQRGIFPSFAAGVLNVTTGERGRFGIDDPLYSDIQDAASFYGVMTYVAGPGMGSFPSWVMVSLGWGSGLFSKDNEAFGKDGSGGIFGSVAFDFQAGDGAFIRAILEYDGFDVNVGATANLSGLEFHLGVVSIDQGSATKAVIPGDVTRSGPGLVYNQAKFYGAISIDARVLGVLPWIWTEGEQ